MHAYVLVCMLGRRRGGGGGAPPGRLAAPVDAGCGHRSAAVPPRPYHHGEVAAWAEDELGSTRRVAQGVALVDGGPATYNPYRMASRGRAGSAWARSHR
jgi:hypothetical protein